MSQNASERLLEPERDLTPFVQGIYYKAEYLGKYAVLSENAQDHGCMDEATKTLLSRPSSEAQHVTIKITTKCVRIKSTASKVVLYNFPIFYVSYCGTDKTNQNVFSFVARDVDSGNFHCYVFKCRNEDKAYALALSIAKAFYLAYQILLAERGAFHDVPPRETVFEPQLDTDTKASPKRPDITTILHQAEMDSKVPEETDNPPVRVTKPSESDSLSSHISGESVDDDFLRLAKARSNPDILRSTLEPHVIAHVSFDTLRVHADPGSVNPSPAGSPAIIRKP